MKADKNFDFYEFAGIVMPGAILIFGLAQSEALISQTIPLSNMSLGSLGVFMILSYAACHLVQSVGGFLEKFWWWWYGMPTDWLRANRCKLISEQQRTAIQTQTPLKLGLSVKLDLDKVSKRDWFGYTRQIYATVHSCNKSARVDTFNGNYGLNRGMCVSLLLVAAVVLIKSQSNWVAASLLVVGALLGALRMHRFGKHYARELFVQFLQLPMPAFVATEDLPSTPAIAARADTATAASQTPDSEND